MSKVITFDCNDYEQHECVQAIDREHPEAYVRYMGINSDLCYVYEIE
jgi:hypothetical protein